MRLLFSAAILFLIFMLSCSKNLEAGSNTTTAASDNANLVTTQSNDSNVNIEKAAAVNKDFFKTYEGSINDKHQIRMSLHRYGNELSGTYLYTSQGKDIQIIGTIDEQDNVVINEFDNNSNQTGVFKGKYSASGITGTWSKPNGDKEMPFSLRATGEVSNEIGDAEDVIEEGDVSEARLDREARDVAREFWRTHLIKCGDSYFLSNSNQQVFELKDEPRFEFYGEALNPRELSRTERLNGVDPLPVEWKGTVRASFDIARRFMTDDKVYGPWDDATVTSWEYTLTKRKGKWVFHPSNPYQLSCGKLRQMGMRIP